MVEVRRTGPGGPAPTPHRDGFLDVVRAIALVRVVAWHAFGLPVLTYLVAAVPAMFFVTGTLYARSLDRHGARATVRDRFRRLLPPLWAFAAVAWAAMGVAAGVGGTSLPLHQVALWLVPVADPAGTAWEGGWLSSPLWYLRVLVWLLALGPLVVAAVRRWPRGALVAGAAALVGLEVVDRVVAWHPAFAPHLVWVAGDLVLYGLFFAVGVRAHHGALDGLRPGRALALAAAAGLGALLWWWTQPVPLGVANNSHPLHLLVGAAWLALALAARPWLAGLARRPVTGPAVAFLGRRSLSVYLWHSAAIAVVLWVLAARAPLPEPLETVAYVVLVALGTVALALAAGWVEDLAARRPARWWPLPRRAPGPAPASARRTWGSGALPWATAAVAGLAVVGVAATVVAEVATTRPEGSTQVAARRPPVPSQAPPLPRYEAVAAPDELGLDGVALLPSSRPAVIDGPTLEETVAAWMAAHDVTGTVVGMAEPGGGSWVGAAGVDDEGEPLLGDRPIDTMSVTKLFTANLVYRAVDAGLIDLDAPLPTLEAVPDFPYTSMLTPRDLLAHRSGLVNYRDTDRYRDDPASVATPVDALAAVGEAPLSADPGTTAEYSSTNYLLLGYLLEQVTGRAYDEMLADDLLVPLGLAATEHLPSEPSEPRFATAGVQAPLGDLLAAGLGLLRDHVGISDAAYQALMDIDPDDGMSPGAISYCPCTVEPDGTLHHFAVGYAGATVWLAYLPAYDLVAAVDVTGGLFEGDRLAQVVELVQALADQVRPADLVEPAGLETGPAGPTS